MTISKAHQSVTNYIEKLWNNFRKFFLHLMTVVKKTFFCSSLEFNVEQFLAPKTTILFYPNIHKQVSHHFSYINKMQHSAYVWDFPSFDRSLGRSSIHHYSLDTFSCFRLDSVRHVDMWHCHKVQSKVTICTLKYWNILYSLCFC